jgi:predicted chitinase
MPNLAAARRALYLAPLNQAMQAHGIDTPLRSAAFIAQLAHESGEFRWMEEIWGPTAAQLRYEPPGDLAQRLGNTQAGDGKRFKGRGPIQITGRFNYKKYGDLLDVDLCADPARAAAPDLAFATAGLYWRSNGLNELADVRDFVAITKRINGGTNGLADRQMYYARALAALLPAAPRGVPLLRGFEAISADGAPRKVAKKAAKKASVKSAAKKSAANKTAPKPASAKKAAKKAAAKKAPPRRKA